MTNLELRAKVRTLMASGALPSAPHVLEKVGAAALDGKARMVLHNPQLEPCSICDEPGPQIAYFWPGGPCACNLSGALAAGAGAVAERAHPAVHLAGRARWCGCSAMLDRRQTADLAGPIIPRMDLGWLVWDKVERGRLFVLPDSQCWVGPGTGQQCVVCEQRVQDGNKCEVAGPDGPVFAHLECHTAWSRESQVRRQKPDSIAPS